MARPGLDFARESDGRPKPGVAKRRALLVLGMHRSGTSALTRTLGLAGADLPRELMPPAPDNVTGFWESREIADLHDRMLASAGTSWDDFSPINASWFESEAASGFRSQIVEILHREFAGSPLFVIKDPRTCRLVPFWLKTLEDLDAEPSVVLCFRNPLEVVDSLRRRNRFPAAKSLLMWLRHVVDAERASRGVPRAVVSYESLIRNWRATIARLGQQLGITWPRTSHLADASIDEFLDPGLRHAVWSIEDVRTRHDLVDWIRTAYEALLRAELELDERFSHALGRIGDALDTADRAFGPVIAVTAEERKASDAMLAGARAEAARLEQALAEARAALERVSMARDGLAEERERLAQERDALSQSAEEQRLRAEGAQTALADERECFAQKRDALSQSAEEQRVRAEGAHTALADLAKSLAEQRESLSRARDEITAQTALASGALKRIERKDRSILELERRVRAGREREAAFSSAWVRERHRVVEKGGDTAVHAFGLSAATAQRNGLEQQRRLSNSAAEPRAAALERQLQGLLQATSLRLTRIVRIPIVILASLFRHAPPRFRDLSRLPSQALAVRRSGLFDALHYLKQQPWPYRSNTQPLIEYLLSEDPAASDPHPLFDSRYYLERNPDVATSNPLIDFLESGDREGRDPSPWFDVAYYKAHRGDGSPGMNTLSHYLIHGGREGREPNAWFDTGFYLEKNPEVVASGVNPLAHFVQKGMWEGRDPSPWFDTTFYLTQAADVVASGLSPFVHFLTVGVYRGLDPVPLFDTSYYVEQYPDVARSGANPYLHFLKYGLSEARNPTPWFDSSFYLERSPDLAPARIHPLLHYLDHGAKEGREPNAWFDTGFYLEKNPEVVASGVNPLAHFVQKGMWEGRDPSPLFDTTHYLSQLAEADTGGLSPIAHFLARGSAQGLDPSPWFDSSYYMENTPVSERPVINPFLHFLTVGWKAGRKPTPWFDTNYYIETSRDLRGADDLNPLLHYVRYGSRERRNPNPWFDTSFYLDRNKDVAGSGLDPVLHYIQIGGHDGRNPSPRFDSSFYLEANPDIAKCGMNPLVHYLLAGAAEGRRPHPGLASASSDVGIASYYADHFWTPYEEVRGHILARERERIGALRCEPPPLIKVLEHEALSRAAQLSFAAVARPVVSIIIPVYDNAALTIECLESVAHSTSELDYELIVFDNGSAARTQACLAAVRGIRVIRSESNLGFGPACNEAAKAARGEFLLILNNDVQVTPGWLSGLVGAFRENPETGAVGPKVLYPDGRLQEAGTVLNPDCSTGMVGLFDDPSLPRYNYLREVDYCSGVCLLVEASRFRELGGFSDAFAPAYCEDCDLCLRLRERGLRCLYQPASVVVHHLSATSNSLGATQKMEWVVKHQQKLAERHLQLIDDTSRVKLIAFVLPQFHPIPENDQWWGRGFTEWHNVARARPNFRGHDQPRQPADLGFYDLRLADVGRQQAALAERYGIYGFCYYYYWFAGKRLLERPLENRLNDLELKFPFCVAWANENWTHRWDGHENEILIGQVHGDDDDRRVMQDVLRYFEHPAYIRINGRPLFLLYRASLLPDVRRTTDIWRAVARKQRGEDLYLVHVESFGASHQAVTPRAIGFDASVEFPPHGAGAVIPPPADLVNPEFNGRVRDYKEAALEYATRSLPGYMRFRTVMPGWDNTPRRQSHGDIFWGSSPGAYRAWLETIVRQTREQAFGDERLVFVNAWNEWAEGAYLEPDIRHGHAFLEATRLALENRGLP